MDRELLVMHRVLMDAWAAGTNNSPTIGVGDIQEIFPTATELHVEMIREAIAGEWEGGYYGLPRPSRTDADVMLRRLASA